MTFYASHIYHEGNVVVDNFTNMGLSSPILVWLDSPWIAVHVALFQIMLVFLAFASQIDVHLGIQVCLTFFSFFS